MSQFDQRGQHIGRDQYIAGRDQYNAGRDIIIHQTPAEPQINLEEAEATYRQQVVALYNRLNFSGFEYGDPSLADVLLENIFVHLTLTVEKTILEPIPPEELNEKEQREGRQPERKITVQEPAELAQALSQHLLIVGEPGAGKSTLLRWLAVTFAQGRQREVDRLGPSADGDRLPVLVELGRLPERYLRVEGGETPNWIQFLPEHITGQMAFTSVPPQLLTHALVTGRCLLLFDGLDEVASRPARIGLTQSLADLARLYGNRVVIGSRPSGVMSESILPSLFRQSHIVRFTPSDVHRFFHFSYALAGDERLTHEQRQAEADALYDRVQAIPALLQLATTPLLSTILVLIWRKEGSILPERRVELYERCCRVLIEDWEAAHRINYQGELADLGWEDHLCLLMTIAYTIHSQKQRTNATKDELVPLVATTLQTIRHTDKQVALGVARQFLATLGLRSGLLQYVGDDRYGFPHQTFQEYLAARYIAAQPDPKYIDLVMTHLHEAGWREVHVLTIGCLGSVPSDVRKAHALMMTILRRTPPPSTFLRPSRFGRFQARQLGRKLPQIQLERRIEWALERDVLLVARGYAECSQSITEVSTTLLARAISLVQQMPVTYFTEQVSLLAAIQCSLKQHGDDSVTLVLLAALHDPDADVQMAAVQSLGQLGVSSEPVILALLGILHEPPSKENRYLEEKVKEKVVQSLGLLRVSSAPVMQALLGILHEPPSKENRYLEEKVKEKVVQSLGQLGVSSEPVIQLLLNALRDPGVHRRESAVEILGELRVRDEAVVQALLGILHEPSSRENQYLKRKVVESLGLLGVSTESVIQTLLDFALQPAAASERWQRSEQILASTAVARSLGQLGVSSEPIIQLLLNALRDPDVHRRESAVEILGELRVRDEAVVQALLDALNDSDRAVRECAAQSLGQLGVNSEPVIQALLNALHDRGFEQWNLFEAVYFAQDMYYRENLHVQVAAAKSLSLLGASNETVIQALIGARKDFDEILRRGAAESLGLLGVSSEPVIQALIDATHDRDYEVRVAAVQSLERLGGDSQIAVQALLDALRDFRSAVRKVAAESLGRVEIRNSKQLREILQALNRCLHDYDEVRRSALKSLQNLLNDRPFPDSHWVPLQKRRARHLRFKRAAFWLGTVAITMTICLATTWLLGTLAPDSFFMRFLAALIGITGLIAAVVQVLGRTLRDPWSRKQS